MNIFQNLFPKRSTLIKNKKKSMKVKLLSGKGTAGTQSRMMGVNLQTPTLADKQGRRIDESPLKVDYEALYKNYIRKPNGSESYKIKDTNDPEVQYLLNNIFPDLPESVGHDITWPPQLPPQRLLDWVTPRLKRIAVFNEPPMHTKPGDVFETAEDCIKKMVQFYNAHPNYQDIMFFHSGKPEVVELELANPKGVALHREYLEKMSQMVAEQKLPARIATTHKLERGYGSDKLTFYRDLLNDYRWYFGHDVKVLFHEYKWARSEEDTLEQVLLAAEFLLVMSRLIFEEGDVIEGGSFQNLAGPGTTNIFGLNNPTDRQWEKGGMFNLWNLFTDAFTNGQYIETLATDRPVEVQVEVFKVGNRYQALYSNLSNEDVQLALPARSMKFINGSLSVKEQAFDKVLRANTCGVIYQ